LHRDAKGGGEPQEKPIRIREETTSDVHSFAARSRDISGVELRGYGILFDSKAPPRAPHGDWRRRFGCGAGEKDARGVAHAELAFLLRAFPSVRLRLRFLVD